MGIVRIRKQSNTSIGTHYTSSMLSGITLFLGCSIGNPAATSKQHLSNVCLLFLSILSRIVYRNVNITEHDNGA